MQELDWSVWLLRMGCLEGLKGGVGYFLVKVHSEVLLWILGIVAVDLPLLLPRISP